MRSKDISCFRGYGHAYVDGLWDWVDTSRFLGSKGGSAEDHRYVLSYCGLWFIGTLSWFLNVVTLGSMLRSA